MQPPSKYLRHLQILTQAPPARKAIAHKLSDLRAVVISGDFRPRSWECLSIFWRTWRKWSNLHLTRWRVNIFHILGNRTLFMQEIVFSFQNIFSQLDCFQINRIAQQVFCWAHTISSGIQWLALLISRQPLYMFDNLSNMNIWSFD